MRDKLAKNTKQDIIDILLGNYEENRYDNTYTSCNIHNQPVPKQEQHNRLGNTQHKHLYEMSNRQFSQLKKQQS